MKPSAILKGKSGQAYFVLGNEAIVRGALEGGLQFSATYPGTPSSEIGDILFAIAEDANLYFEFSVNEKVAMEVAASGAACGLRSMVFMKHVGLNVAADPFMTTLYTGTKGGLAIIVADDPSVHSSQNEQDTRHYSRISGAPMLEPSNPSDAHAMMQKVFALSEQVGRPFLVRTSTRVAHVRAGVKFGDIDATRRHGNFEKNPSKWVPVPAFSYRMHQDLLTDLEKAAEISENSEFNYEIVKGNPSKKGIITSGCAYNYVMDVVNEHNCDVTILKLGMTAPIPEKKLVAFLKKCDQVMVVEELEPYLEEAARIVAQKEKIPVEIFGKLSGNMSRMHEYNTDIVERALAPFMGFEIADRGFEIPELELPSRPPVLCPGCSHRALYYSVNKGLGFNNAKNCFFSSDIGCYTLGVAPPASAADYLLCMGSSGGVGSGVARATGKKSITFVGDSTFFHSGVLGLLNAYHNDHNILYIISDNRTTAMTGHQPLPTVEGNLAGVDAKAVDIEQLVRGIGIEKVQTIDAYNTKKLAAAVKEAMAEEGLNVIIARRPCALAESRKKEKRPKFRVNPEKCTGCFICLKQFACPAYSKKEDKSVISQELCFGCGVCAQVCPSKAVEVVR